MKVVVRSFCFKFFSTVYFQFLLLADINCETTEDKYNSLRDDIIHEDLKYLLGSRTNLSDPREVKVNNILMTFKEEEFLNGIQSQSRLFPAAQNFFAAKEDIEKSKIFQIIKLLPKGANLHLHLEPAGDINYTISTITKWDDLYYCIGDNETLIFRFSNRLDDLHECSNISEWKSVKDLYNQRDEENVTQWFRSSMTMAHQKAGSLNEHSNEIDATEAWNRFEKAIATILSLITYEKAFKQIYYNTLKDHYNDNVMYLEIRTPLQSIYRLDQSKLSSAEVMYLLKEVTEQFIKNFPEFWGTKIIYAPHRFHDIKGINKSLQESIMLKEMFPTFFAGFDLVGQEDKGVPLTKFLPQFLNAAKMGIKFFFHSGETNWYGTSIDENLVDSILLNTARIGHGFALYRHPLLYEMVKNSSIAIEVCPISNQVLQHVQDLRMHPAALYFRDGFPVVVASDDPGIWGAAPLSHDWYFAFMAVAGQKADLRFLKQLAKNSIIFSAMNESEKEANLKKWELKWEDFLESVIERFH